jgi:AAA+ superfamily predicted ATPase
MSRTGAIAERSDELSQVLLDRLPHVLSAAQSSDTHQVLVAIRKMFSHMRESNPDLVDQLNERMFGGPKSAAGPSWAQVTRTATATPLDQDTNSPLVRLVREENTVRPVLPPEINEVISELISEHRKADQLIRAGLQPRYTLLLSGPPGVGKTMLAQWVAKELGWPLAQIELSTAISSFLGKTGQNLKELLDFARANQIVLLLDEFDAIAKRRDDQSELGELKRIVSVLLKELEEWSGPSVVIAATNHQDLIDPAIFRRFQITLQIPIPDARHAEEILSMHLGPTVISKRLITFGAELLAGSNGSDIRNFVLDVRRHSLLYEVPINEVFLRQLASKAITTEQKKAFCKLAISHLSVKNRSYSILAGLIGVAKSTVSNYLNSD